MNARLVVNFLSDPKLRITSEIINSLLMLISASSINSKYSSSILPSSIMFNKLFFSAIEFSGSNEI